jgi:plasmid stabilization system protein ParE
MAGSVSEIKWANEAIKDLRTIFDYYFQTASHSVAQTIINGLQEKVEVLYLSPYIGQTEPLLEHLNLDVRYLVEGNYKIFYNYFDGIVFILFIFDCRQNPDKVIQLFG